MTALYGYNKHIMIFMFPMTEQLNWLERSKTRYATGNPCLQTAQKYFCPTRYDYSDLLINSVRKAIRFFSFNNFAISEIYIHLPNAEYRSS